MAARTFTRGEAAKHNKDGGLKVDLDAAVSDLSQFAKSCPGAGLASLSTKMSVRMTGRGAPGCGGAP